MREKDSKTNSRTVRYDNEYLTLEHRYVNGSELEPQWLKALRKDQADARRQATKTKLKHVELIPPGLDLSEPCLREEEVKKMDIGPQKWNCKACTFLNAASATTCAICT